MSNHIEQMDVLDFLQAQPDGVANLIIADPPYGIGKNFGAEIPWSTTEEWSNWCKLWLAECKRVLADDGNLLLYGIHNYICYNQVALYELGMQYRRQFIWHYENGFCGNKELPRATYEPILWFSKTDNFYFTEMREPYKSQSRLKYAIKKNGKVWKPNPEGRIAGDVWNIPTLSGRSFRDEKVGHPTQKSLKISERLVKHFSPREGHIIIPFCGSGSECVASVNLERTFSATEINPKFIEIAQTRVEAAVRNREMNQEEVNTAVGSKGKFPPLPSTVSH